MFVVFKNRRRAALRREPLTAAERAIVNKNVPFVATFDDEDRKELEGLVRIFLARSRSKDAVGWS